MGVHVAVANAPGVEVCQRGRNGVQYCTHRGRRERLAWLVAVLNDFHDGWWCSQVNHRWWQQLHHHRKAWILHHSLHVHQPRVPYRRVQLDLILRPAIA